MSLIDTSREIIPRHLNCGRTTRLCWWTKESIPSVFSTCLSACRRIVGGNFLEWGSVRTEIRRTRGLNLAHGQIEKLKVYSLKVLKVLRKSAIIEGLVPIAKSQGQRWSQER